MYHSLKGKKIMSTFLPPECSNVFEMFENLGYVDLVIVLSTNAEYPTIASKDYKHNSL